jgi:hypothetical protein
VLLEIRRGTARRRLRPVPGPVFLIGGSSQCDLVLADPQFPEMHAYLLVSDHGVTLRHLGLAPEITVNGRAVEAAELLDGDRLRTGPYEFRLHLLLAPEGPGASDAAQPRRHAARPHSAAVPSPLAQIRALVAEVRAKLPCPHPYPMPTAASAVIGRDAA